MTWESFIPARDMPLWWHACGIALVVAFFLVTRAARSAHIIVVCLIRLPAVILHELAHFLTGILLRAEPTRFSLIPARRSDGRWTLGSVAFRRVTPFNAVPIAFAPLGLIPFACWLYSSWFDWLPRSLPNTLLLYGTVFLVVSNALPSLQDLRVACNWKSLLLYGGVTGLILYVWIHF